MVIEELTLRCALERLKLTRAFLLDMDGTFYIGDRLIEGSLAFLSRVGETGRRAIFLTNNSSRSAKAYAKKLARLGVPCGFTRVYTSGNAASRVLRERYGGLAVYVVGTDELSRELTEDGVNVTCDYRDAELLLLAYDTSLTYDKLRNACHMARAGLPYIATHPDINCPSEFGPLPDIGSFVALIRSSTGRLPDMVIGKPERGIIDTAAASLGAAPSEAAMVGDRLYTDVAAGVNAGALSICVLTGEATIDDIRSSAVKPDVVVDRLADLIDYI